MSKAKAKGTGWEVRVRDFLRAHGFPMAERLPSEGTKDRGDISGVPFVIEAKNCRTVTLASWCDEAAKQARTAGLGNRWAVTFPRRSHRTEKAYVVISLETFAELLRLVSSEERAGAA